MLHSCSIVQEAMTLLGVHLPLHDTKGSHTENPELEGLLGSDEEAKLDISITSEEEALEHVEEEVIEHPEDEKMGSPEEHLTSSQFKAFAPENTCTDELL